MYVVVNAGYHEERFCGDIDEEVRSIKFKDYVFPDENYPDEPCGLKVSINGRKTELTESFTYEELLDEIPDGYDYELLSDIERTLGIKNEEDTERSADEVQTRLTDLALKHAGLVKVITDQPHLLGLVEKIREMEDKAKKSAEEKSRVDDKVIALQKELETLRDQHVFLQREFHKLKGECSMLHNEREQYKQNILQKLKDAVLHL